MRARTGHGQRVVAEFAVAEALGVAVAVALGVAAAAVLGVAVAAGPVAVG